MPYLSKYGNQEQREKYIPNMTAGKIISSIAMTEPGCGSDLKAISTRARRQGDHYVIDGAKTFITNGFSANLLVLAVRTGDAGSKGVSLVVLETENLPGFRVGRRLEKLGQHASDTAELYFDAMRVPVANLIGAVEGHGFAQLMSQLPYERMLLTVPAAAVIETAVALTVDRWDEDWSCLAWVMLRGRAEVLDSGAEHDDAQAALREDWVAAYRQYCPDQAACPAFGGD